MAVCTVPDKGLIDGLLLALVVVGSLDVDSDKEDLLLSCLCRGEVLLEVGKFEVDIRLN